MRGWRDTGQAAVSLLLIVGFYAIVLGYVIGLAFGGGMLLYQASRLNVLLLILGGLVLGGLLGAMVVSLLGLRKQTRPQIPYGMPVYRDDAPELWRLIATTASAVGVKEPDRLLITANAGASAWEHRRLFGLFPANRGLAIGVPLLAGFSISQLRAVIAHELAHHARQHTRLRALSYRGHVAVAGVLTGFARRRWNPLAWLFRGYALLYFLVQRGISRRHELDADRIAGQVAGRRAAQAALRATPVLEQLWHHYLDEYVLVGQDVGLAPRAVCGDFSTLLAARAEQYASLCRDVPNEPPSRWDTHPPIAERLWALESAPDSESLVDGRPATALLGEFATIAGRLDRTLFGFEGCRRLDWPEYVREAWITRVRPIADAAYRAIGRATGEHPATLEAVLTRCAAGEAEDLASRLYQANLPQDGLSAIVLVAAYQAGSVRPEHRWDAPARLGCADGRDIVAVLAEVEHVVAEAVDDPAGAVARARTALASLGVNPGTPGGAAQVSPSGAEPVGGIANVKLDGRSHHLVITDIGLVLTPCVAKALNPGDDELRALLERRPAELVRREGAVWLPYEEFARVTIDREIPIKATLRRHDGVAHKLVETYTGHVEGESRETLRALLARHT